MNAKLNVRHLFHGLAGALLALLGTGTAAQDARLGAELYMQLPGGVASCFSCHGPEPQGNRNSLLKAANNPPALTKALATVGVMSYLRASLDEDGIRHLAAFLGSVNQAASSESALTLWPLTADFGSLGVGAAGGPQLVQIANRSTQPLRLNSLQLQGSGYSLQHDCPGNLSAGAQCQASISFVAGSPGQFAGALRLNSPDLSTPLVVALASVVRPTAAGDLTWSGEAGPLDFSATALGETAARTLTLINRGIAPVTLGAAPQVFGSLTSTGSNLTPLSFSGCGFGTVLQPAGTCQITVRYTASGALGTQSVLQIRSNGANPPAMRIFSSERVAAAPSPAPPPIPASVPAPAESSTAGGALDVRPRSLWVWLTLLLAIAVLRHSRARMEP